MSASPPEGDGAVSSDSSDEEVSCDQCSLASQTTSLAS